MGEQQNKGGLVSGDSISRHPGQLPPTLILYSQEQTFNRSAHLRIEDKLQGGSATVSAGCSNVRTRVWVPRPTHKTAGHGGACLWIQYWGPDTGGSGELAGSRSSWAGELQYSERSRLRKRRWSTVEECGTPVSTHMHTDMHMHLYAHVCSPTKMCTCNTERERERRWPQARNKRWILKVISSCQLYTNYTPNPVLHRPLHIWSMAHENSIQSLW